MIQCDICGGAILTGVTGYGGKICFCNLANRFTETTPNEKALIETIESLRAQLAETKMQWIDVSVERPKFIEGENYSENVFGIYKDCQGNLVLSVFQLIYVDADAEGSGWVWAKISENYSDLRYAECKFDDNYEVIRWSPIFELPKLENK